VKYALIPMLAAAAVLYAGLAPPASADEALDLCDPAKKTLGWRFDNGREFPGATGSLSVEPGGVLKLVGDFTGGGAYVQAGRSLPNLDVTALSLELHAPQARWLTVRIIDAGGQCHQIKLRLEKADGWRRVRFPLAEFFEKMGRADAVPGVMQYQHWGGDNDGKWHGPARGLYFLTGAMGENKVSTVRMRNIQVSVVAAGKPAFREPFEASDKVPAGWQVRGDAAVVEGAAFEGKRCLVLSRKQEQLDEPTEAASPKFAVRPGLWDAAGAFRAELYGPDTSYNVAVVLECLDATGRQIERLTVAETVGKMPWRVVRKRLTVPPGATAARFRATLNKTWGRFWMDDLSGTYAGAAPRERRIARALLTTDRLGNLLLPGDAPVVHLTLEARKAIPTEQCKVEFVLRDYWGAEQAKPGSAALAPAGEGKGGIALYKADLPLDGEALETGRYYEVHIRVAGGDDEPFTDYTTLAVLPEAPAKKHPWRDIPFTSRNWDNRIPAYFHLSDRLGIRICGIWSRWSASPPYPVNAPRWDYITGLNMGAVMGTQGNTIERHRKGYEKYTEEVLREGAARLVREYNKDGRIAAVCLGNEPHGKGEKVLEDVRAYKAMYEGAKEADPDVRVLGTSSGPLEQYFAAGFGAYCDMYDFHTYGGVETIRRTFARYRELFAKYGHEKPIWSTELGLNSQGMTRRAVAGDLVRKFTTFFACGGENCSWFGILYPDRQGKIHGSASEAHNVFFSRYNCYCPKLDALAYYNMVNGICIKKFVEEKQYGDLRASLFRDEQGRCLQVLWSDGDAQDVFVPLKGAAAVRRILIDGSTAPLDAGGEGLTLRVTRDPMLLLYEAPSASLPEKLGAPRVSVTAAPKTAIKGGSVEVPLALDGLRASDLSVQAPPFWRADVQAGPEANTAVVTLTSPVETDVREALVRVLLNAKGERPAGELAFLLPVEGALTMKLLPRPWEEGKPGARLVVGNQGGEPQEVSWQVELEGEAAIAGGAFPLPALEPSRAHFADAADGTCTVPAGGEQAIDLPLADIDALNLYRLHARVTDGQGRATEAARHMGGFAAAPRVRGKVTLDGRLDEENWARATVCRLNEARQFRSLGKGATWEGPQDLSGRLRFLWDDKGLYLAMEVEDDVFSNPKQDAALWQQDGLQLLIDPCRGSAEKGGKYDYSLGLGQKGPQAWCHLAPAGMPGGEAKDVVVAAQPIGKAGGIVYEVFFPWSRLAPFAPAVGANLGLAVVLNEDDGDGRASFLTWFGDIQTKQIDAVGDVILVSQEGP